jgi:hypothetical protein
MALCVRAVALAVDTSALSLLSFSLMAVKQSIPDHDGIYFITLPVTNGYHQLNLPTARILFTIGLII